MNNDYKWETVGRCKFYTDGTTCTDIEVMDDTKEISFIYPKIMINRERCQKVFSSVEVMLIGRNVISIVIPSEPPPLISGEQKSNGGLVHPQLKGFDEPKRVSDTRLLEGLLTVLSFTLFSPGHAVRFPKLSARQRLKPMPIGR